MTFSMKNLDTHTNITNTNDVNITMKRYETTTIMTIYKLDIHAYEMYND